MPHDAAHRIQSPERAGSASEVAARHETADERGAHGRALRIVERDGRHDVHREAALGAEAAQRVDVAGAAATEAVIVPDHEFAHAETAEENPVHELRGVEALQIRRERQDRHVVDAAERDDLGLLEPHREERRRGGGVHDLERVRIEGDEQAREAARVRARRDALKHIPVPPVYAIERADGDDRSSHVGRKA